MKCLGVKLSRLAFYRLARVKNSTVFIFLAQIYIVTHMRTSDKNAAADSQICFYPLAIGRADLFRKVRPGPMGKTSCPMPN